MRFLVTKLAASLVFVLCAVWYAQAHFYRDPGSAFFDERRAYEQRYSSHRKAEVERFIQSRATLARVPDAPAKAGDNASLCVAFSSVKRQHVQYLEVRVPEASNATELTNPDGNRESPVRPQRARTGRPCSDRPRRRDRPRQTSELAREMGPRSR